jgi:hypothetical protein
MKELVPAITVALMISELEGVFVSLQLSFISL